MQNKTKLLLGSASVSAVVAGVALTGGTSAYYYDLERTEGNSFSACSLDLRRSNTTITQTGYSQGPESTQATSNVTTAEGEGNEGNDTITLAGLQPGDQFTVRTILANNGNCSGELWADINFPISDMENGMSDAEAADGDVTPDDETGPNPSNAPHGGELDDVLQVEFSDTFGNSLEDDFHDLAYRGPDKLVDNFGPTSRTGTGPNRANVITMILTVPEGTRGQYNRIMGDSFTFAVDFALAQQNKLTGGALN